MIPELGQAVGADANGQGPAVAVVEVNSASAAGPGGIELDSVLCKADPISTTGIDRSVIWPSFRSSKFGGIGFEMYFGEQL